MTGNLPVSLSSFIGRDHQRAEVTDLLRSQRLLTLTGPGGVGKTRLALRVAAQVAHLHPDGVWLVELAPISNPLSIPLTVAKALSLPENPGAAPLDRLTSELRGRRLLLVLDNCEHVISGAAELAAALLHSCADLTIVATSREPLDIAGEQVWTVPPMSLPHEREDLKTRKLAQHDSIRLFVDRAKQKDSRFALTTETAPFIAQLCRRLDGVPLAIELAAARVGSMSVAQIAERLDDSFALLSRGDRSSLPRQQSLEAALQWSDELLDGPERALLRRISVFTGGFTLEAAEEVCSGERAEGRVFDLLSVLVAKSLLVFDPSGLHPRYRLLETVRFYARERLGETGEEAELRRSHARWCASLAEKLEPELSGPSPGSAMQRLTVEYENLQSALDWAIEADTELAARMAASLILFWNARRYFGEGLEWLDRVLASLGSVLSTMDAAPKLLRAKVLWGSAMLTSMVRPGTDQRPLLEESLAIARIHGDGKLAARVLTFLGFVSMHHENPHAALPLVQEAVTLARDTGDDAVLAGALGACGRVHMFHGDSPSAWSCFSECIDVARRSRQRRNFVDGLQGLGWAELAQGDLRSAEKTLNRALEVTGDGERYQRALVLTLLGELALQLESPDRHARAAGYFDQGLDLARALQVPFPLTRCLSGLGRVRLEQGDGSGAASLLDEAVTVARRGPGSHMLSAPLIGRGQVAHAAGDCPAARALFEEALAVGRERDDRIAVARATAELAALTRDEGDEDASASLHYQALSLRDEICDRPGIAQTIDGIAGLAAIQGRAAMATRLFGAGRAIREEIGAAYTQTPAERDRYGSDLGLAREALSRDEFRSAWEDGTRLSLKEAVSYASRGRGSRRRPAMGWASLTPSEVQIVEHVQQGMTNPEIAKRLFVSPRTVQWHMAGIFGKMGVNSRRELRELPPGN